MPPTPETITLPIFCKDYLPVVFSGLSLIFSGIMLFVALSSTKKTRLITQENATLQAKLEDTNNQRHWRREKIYSLADSLYELSTEYWLTDEDNLENKKRALAMKSRIEDIEENAITIGIDISKPIQNLRHYATGDTFETADRKAVSTSHERFSYIRLYTQQIKSSLS